MFERRRRKNNTETTASIAVGVAALLLAPLLVPKLRRGAKSLVIEGGRNAYNEAVTSVTALGELISNAAPFKKGSRSLAFGASRSNRQRAKPRRKRAV